MKIQLEQADIERAISAYLITMGITRNVHKMEFSTTRNPVNVIADIQLNDLSAPVSSIGSVTARGPQESHTLTVVESVAVESDPPFETNDETPVTEVSGENEPVPVAAPESSKRKLFSKAATNA